eukprot:2176406-Alexandrium_andersonii.AAC.1
MPRLATKHKKHALSSGNLGMPKRGIQNSLKAGSKEVWVPRTSKGGDAGDVGPLEKGQCEV